MQLPEELRKQGWDVDDSGLMSLTVGIDYGHMAYHQSRFVIYDAESGNPSLDTMSYYFRGLSPEGKPIIEGVRNATA